MSGLLSSMAAWLPFTLAPVLLVLLAPTASSRARAWFAAALGVLAIPALALAVLQAGETRGLEIVNPFFNPDRGEPVPFVVDVIEAPGWQSPVVCAAYLLLPATLLHVLRHRARALPCPVTYASILTVWTFVGRLALELSAAPAALTWATGVTLPMLLMLPFVGWWSGARRYSFGRFVLMLLLLAIVQRSLIVGFGYFATTAGLGTHLDVGAIRKVTLLVGHHDFSGPGDQTVAQWRTLILVPQYLLWVPLTIILGIVLGTLPFVAARKSHPRGPDAGGQALPARGEP